MDSTAMQKPRQLRDFVISKRMHKLLFLRETTHEVFFKLRSGGIFSNQVGTHTYLFALKSVNCSFSLEYIGSNSGVAEWK